MSCDAGPLPGARSAMPVARSAKTAVMHTPNDITIRRDMVVILSTLRGEICSRNFFIPLLAKELCSIDDSESFHSIIVSTAIKMCKSETQGGPQTPLFLSAMTRELHLVKLDNRQGNYQNTTSTVNGSDETSASSVQHHDALKLLPLTLVHL